MYFIVLYALLILCLQIYIYIIAIYYMLMFDVHVYQCLYSIWTNT